MIFYNKDNIVVRTLKENDKRNYLNLYVKEKSLYDILYPDSKLPIYEEERIISKVINKEIISEEILVITDSNKFIGYSVIERTAENRYDIRQFIIDKSYRENQYDKILLDVIKKSAEKDKCDIYVNCPNYEYYNKNFYINIGGFKSFGSNVCFYENLKDLNKPGLSLFYDYELIKKERVQRREERIQSYQKLLKSDIGKIIMNHVREKR